MNLVKSKKAFAGLISWLLMTFVSAAAWADVPKETGWSMPVDASQDGHRISWLIDITNVFITILFVVMVIWMVWAVFAHNEKHEAEYDHGDSRHHVTVALTISAIIFVVVDGNLFYNATKDLTEVFWNFDKALSTEGHVKLEVNARQWLWQGRYPGPDNKFNTKDDAITTNDIRIPVDTPVIIQLASPDVIHNMYLPNMRVKMDAVPGSVNQFWFQAKTTGQYEIGCAQHCGQAHYKMRGILTVLPRAEYDEWVAAQSRDAAQLYDPEAKEANWGWSWKKI